MYGGGCKQEGLSTLPADLGEHLQTQGFRFFVRAPGMAADLQELELSPIVPSNIITAPVKTCDQFRQWVNILAKVDEQTDALRDGFYQMFEGLGFSPCGNSQLLLGLEDGRAVATSRLFFAGGVTGIWHVASLPEARRKGYGAEMTLSVVQVGCERGYCFGVLYATAAG